jgi:hypothetical protein
MKKDKKYIVQIAYISSFFLLLLIPNIFATLKLGSKTNCENRTLVQKPKFKYQTEYLQEFGSYFEDNYGLRNEFMHFQSFLKYQYFNSSSNPDEILLGKNDWMFYTSVPDSSYGSFSRTNLLSKQRLHAYKSLHESRQRLLSKNKIDYIIAVWPAPSTIYPEFLPYQMKIQIEDTLSRIDQLVNYFKKENVSIPLIDVRATMLQHKNEHLYQKFDTHWNNLGAYYGYSSFMMQTKSILKQEPYPLSAFRIKMVKSLQQGLFNMIGLCKQNTFIEMNPDLVFKEAKKITDDKEYQGSYGKLQANAPSSLRVLFFRDSYSQYLMQFFSLHFKESYFYWSGYDQNIVDMLKPDVVIVANTERYF